MSACVVLPHDLVRLQRRDTHMVSERAELDPELGGDQQGCLIQRWRDLHGEDLGSMVPHPRLPQSITKYAFPSG